MPRVRVAACQINTVVGDLDGQRPPDRRSPRRGRAGRRRPGRLPGADRHRVPPRGPARPAGLRGRQPGRLRPDRRGQRELRGGDRLRRHRPGRTAVQRRRPVRRGPGARVATTSGCSPTTGSSTSSGGSSPATAPAPLRGGRRAGRDHRLRGHVVPPGSDGQPGRGRRPPAGQPQRLPLLAGPARGAPGRAGRPGGGDRLPRRLREPGRGPGRAGVRRGVPGHGVRGARWWPRPASSSRRCWWPTWTWVRRGLRRAARAGPGGVVVGQHRLPPAGGSPGRRPRWPPCSTPRPRSTRRWCSGPATTWARTGSPTR